MFALAVRVVPDGIRLLTFAEASAQHYFPASQSWVTSKSRDKKRYLRLIFLTVTSFEETPQAETVV